MPCICRVYNGLMINERNHAEKKIWKILLWLLFLCVWYWMGKNRSFDYPTQWFECSFYINSIWYAKWRFFGGFDPVLWPNKYGYYFAKIKCYVPLCPMATIQSQKCWSLLVVLYWRYSDYMRWNSIFDEVI